MKIAPIRNEKDYQKVFDRLEDIFNQKKERKKVTSWIFFQS